MSDQDRPPTPKPPYVTTERELKDREQHAFPHQADLPQQQGGGGAPGTGAEQDESKALEMSEEARNQQRTGEKKVTESGTP